ERQTVNALQDWGTSGARAPVGLHAPGGGSFKLHLSAMPNSRKLAVEWLDPTTAAAIPQSPIIGGSSAQSFSAPFRGDALFCAVDVAGHKCLHTGVRHRASLQSLH